MNKSKNLRRNNNASRNISSLQDDDCVIIEEPIPVIDLCSDEEDNEVANSSGNQRAKRKRRSKSTSVKAINSNESAISPARSSRDLRSSSSTSKRRAKSPLTVNCPICFESVHHRQAASTICGHLFCSLCITEEIRIRNRCPICMRRLYIYHVHPIYFT
ncbi:hypothetical protein RP20_CCG022597 [Aedes albopictus]|nr:hypothetical protein RP20_CCG022597 [Aedes albopictus]